MPHDVYNREPYWRRYDEDEERFGRRLERGRYESGRHFGEASRPDYGSSEYLRERDYDEYSRPSARDYAESYVRPGRRSTYTENTVLLKLGDTDFYIRDEDDIRGRMVLDQNGNEIGDVNDLIIDPRQRRVRFLLVTSGGFLGIGGTTVLVPVEAITRFDRNVIEIDQRAGRGVSGTPYNPTLSDRRTDRGEYESYYGRSYGSYGGYSSTARHRGRSPRGYKRSDDRIREDVNERLSDRGDLDPSDIEVSVNNAEVVLSGTVNTRREKRLAEDIAENVSGVTYVENRLRVKQIAFCTATGRYETTAAAGITESAGSETSTEAATARRGKTTST